MTDQSKGTAAQPDFSALEQRPQRRKLPLRTALIATVLLGAGFGGGATVACMNRPTVELAPVKPVAIKTLSDDGGVISVRGTVAEIFGPMVVLADASGRALVEIGREGDGTGLLAPGQTVTVQGHYRHGMIRASFLVGADGKVTALRPMGPPRGGPGGPGGFRHGPHGPAGRGPDGDDVPPPPPAVAPAATEK